METPHNIISTETISAWYRDVIKEEERYGAPEGSKRQRIYKLCGINEQSC